MGAQAILDVCDEWAREAGLQWGVAKCGVVGCVSPLLLGITPLPVVDSYRYLGVPHRSSGADWFAHASNVCSRFNRFVSAISDQAPTWHPLTRLQVFRCFARPILEYCLPVVTTWCSRNNHLPRVQELHKQLYLALQRGSIFVSGQSRYRSIVDSIVALGTPSWRFTILEARLAEHLARLSPTNPLKQLSSISSSRHHVLSFLPRATLYLEYRQVIRNQTRPHSLKSWLRQKFHQHLDSFPGRLMHYFNSTCRSLNFADPLIYQPNPVAQWGLRWRANASFIGTTCPVCNQPFTRGHIQRCALLQDHPLAVYIPNALWYGLELTRVTTLTGIPYPDITTGYTLLDYTLNVMQYDLFQAFYQHLHSKLYPTASSSSTPPISLTR
jgi:hypothetical protein